MAIIATGSSDQGTFGVSPEPPAGFRHARHRDRALAAFCSAVWQTHTVHHRPKPRMWPTSGAFKANLPGIAFDLIVAAWKISGADAPDQPAPHGAERQHWLYGTPTCDAEADQANEWYRKRRTAVISA